MMRQTLDLDLLRTLLAIAEEASFTRAAEKVGRTQSAVTLQIQKLETLVRQPLLVRSKGARIELTPQGQMLVERARAMLALNDQAFRDLTSPDLPATIRLGTSASYVRFYLARTLEALRAKYPNLPWWKSSTGGLASLRRRSRRMPSPPTDRRRAARLDRWGDPRRVPGRARFAVGPIANRFAGCRATAATASRCAPSLLCHAGHG